MSNVIEISSPDQLRQVVEANHVVVADFWAEWCGPCRALSPLIEKVADEYVENVTVVKVNVDENQELSQMFGIQSIPTVVAWKGSLENGQAFIGVKPYPAIKQFVEDQLK